MTHRPDDEGALGALPPAPTDHPIHPLLAARWSPYAFADRDVDDADLASLLEAARWAPSSYNEQPWRLFVARRDEPEAFERMCACLLEGNRAWAAAAPVLMLTAVASTLARSGEPNAAAEHDLGLAMASMTLEATARGLAVHQMIGIDRERVRAEYALPPDVAAMTGVALGYVGDPARLPEGLRARDGARRLRRPLRETVFGEAYGEPWPGLPRGRAGTA